MLDHLFLTLDSVKTFFDLGGPVVVLIVAVLFAMWFMILERVIYFYGGYQKRVKQVEQLWYARSERFSWYAHKVREQLISHTSVDSRKYLHLIQASIAICPLLGLLGTVTGMIEVFQVIGSDNSNNARAMADGVAKSIIPTMSGMVAALSGFFPAYWLWRKYRVERTHLADKLALDEREGV